MPAIKMTINLPDFVRQKLKLAPFGNRSSSTEIAKTVERYFLILDEEKKYIKQYFSLAEMNLLFEICKNEKFIPASKCKDGVLVSVVNAEDELFASAGIDRMEFRNKLQNLSLIQNVALVEILEGLKD